jgi:hypothetical protein
MTQRPDDDEEIEDEDKPKAGIFFMAGLIYIVPLHIMNICSMS